MTTQQIFLILCVLLASRSRRLSSAFIWHVGHRHGSPRYQSVEITTEAVHTTDDNKNVLIQAQKKKLLGLLRKEATVRDPVLADPVTKQGLTIAASKTSNTWLGGESSTRTKYQLRSPGGTTYGGSTDRFVDLLEPLEESESEESADDASYPSNERLTDLLRRATPLLPIGLRTALATAGLPLRTDYVPMRDLFTSPQVSFAYERGWRQNFERAGFPGPDREAAMAMDYFAPVMEALNGTDNARVLVDMSCATGLFTRRFTKSGKYDRVLGCDYSASMLDEARRRIRRDPELVSRLTDTRVDLVRCDVGQIPMRDGTVPALHAGAAMHCWPDLPLAVSEIRRVLQPGGRYFATTFLSSYFSGLEQTDNAFGSSNNPSRQAFQYFSSVDQLRKLMVEEGGFSPEKVSVEVLFPSCVVIKCEK